MDQETKEIADFVGKEKVISPEFSEIEEFSEEEIEWLKKIEVNPHSIQKLGGGKTRDVYKGVQISKEPFASSGGQVTITLPKQETGDSVCTLINESNMDVDSNEFNVLENVGYHPNIIGSEYSSTPDGRRINVKEYSEGVDLEELVNTEGPLKGKEAQPIISQLLDGVKYLHDNGYLHNDIKPSNTYVDTSLSKGMGDTAAVKLGDCQNAIREDLVEESTMPTRGCTQYAHRDLINALITETPAKPTEKSDVYSLGGTLYFMLTGENPSDYSLEKDPEGKEVNVRGETLKVDLKKGDESIDKISEEEDEERIKNMVQKVPRKYRNLVYGCLTDNPDFSFETVEQVKQYFNNPLLTKLSKVSSGLKDKVNDLKNNVYGKLENLKPDESAEGIVLDYHEQPH